MFEVNKKQMREGLMGLLKHRLNQIEDAVNHRLVIEFPARKAAYISASLIAYEIGIDPFDYDLTCLRLVEKMERAMQRGSRALKRARVSVW